MTIEIACPSCAARLKAPAQLVGKVVKCPRCTTRVVVQETASEQATTTASPSSAATTAAPRAPAPLEPLEPLDDEPQEERLDELPEVDDEAIDEVVAADDEDDDYERRRPKKREKPRRRSFAPTKDERNAAMLIYLLSIFTSFIGPLVLWMMKRDESRFVDHHGKQIMNFLFTLLIAVMILGVLSGIAVLVTFGIALFIVIPLFLALNVGALVIIIIHAMKASRGEWSEMNPAIKFFK
jgi:uncharacterized Tic20 family protein